MNTDTFKQQAAKRAVDFVQSGMVIGLGSGSTVKHALDEIASRLSARQIEGVLGVPSSIETDQIARRLHIPLTSLNRHPKPDITIDGADEVDPQLNLIKGGGGALLREKVLAQASRRNVIIVDGSKLSPRLGSNWPVPVEVLPFAAGSVEQHLKAQGAKVEIRLGPDDRRFQTDQGNIVFDVHFGPIDDPAGLAALLSTQAGILEHGLFIGSTHDLIAVDQTGVRHLTPTSASTF